jgi:hypothetical protein
LSAHLGIGVLTLGLLCPADLHYDDACCGGCLLGTNKMHVTVSRACHMTGSVAFLGVQPAWIGIDYAIRYSRHHCLRQFAISAYGLTTTALFFVIMGDLWGKLLAWWSSSNTLLGAFEGGADSNFDRMDELRDNLRSAWEFAKGQRVEMFDAGSRCWVEATVVVVQPPPSKNLVRFEAPTYTVAVGDGGGEITGVSEASLLAKDRDPFWVGEGADRTELNRGTYPRQVRKQGYIT